MEERVNLLRQIGIHLSVPDALFIQAKASCALGNTEQAIEHLQQARLELERVQARRLLWQIYAALSEIEKERGNYSPANSYRTQARDIIAYIADHTPQEFRISFLHLPSVRAVTDG